EAEPLRERIVVIREKTLGPDHPTVGVALDNLAELYKAAGRTADAKPLHKRSLAIKEKMAALEAEVVTLRDAGKYVEAAEVATQILAALDKGDLSADQNDVGVALHRLAQLYRAQGRYADAEPLLRRSLDIVERAWGPEGTNVAVALHGLADLYTAMGRTAEA